MKYFLKQNLPGIKAGEEMEKHTTFSGWDGKAWYTADQRRSCFIPNSELSDWIEERENGMWQPKEGETWYIPAIVGSAKYKENKWYGDSVDEEFFGNGFVCHTPKLAIELHDRMLETAKKFWEEKE